MTCDCENPSQCVYCLKEELEETTSRAERAEARLEEANRRLSLISDLCFRAHTGKTSVADKEKLIFEIRMFGTRFGPVGPEWPGGV